MTAGPRPARANSGARSCSVLANGTYNSRMRTPPWHARQINATMTSINDANEHEKYNEKNSDGLANLLHLRCNLVSYEIL